jgi:DNA (cytosine-5)-methyltransferase 1
VNVGLSAISLFSGAGGLDIAAKWAGIRTVCYVEFDRYAQAVLMSRIRDGSLDAAPIWSDVTTFDGRPWNRKVDCVFGGFPCTDVSFAGKRECADSLVDGTRSGLWSEFARIIREVRPRFVLVENVPGLLTGGIGDVLRDLAKMGFDAEWEVLSAAAVGAPHLRERVWIVANSVSQPSQKRGNDFADAGESGSGRNIDRGSRKDDRRESDSRPHEGLADSNSTGREVFGRTEPDGNAITSGTVQMADATGQRWREAGQHSERPEERITSGGDVANADSNGRKPWGSECAGLKRISAPFLPGWWAAEPNVGRVVNGLAFRVDRLRLTGNGVVPKQAFPAFEKVKELAGLK